MKKQEVLTITERKEKITRQEIIAYVDELIQRHTASYDKRMQPLLYEFFLRCAEKFGWSKEEFLDKYTNFENNTDVIKFETLPEGIMAKTRVKGQHEKIFGETIGIFVTKALIEGLQKGEENAYRQLIESFFHEAKHQTDYHIEGDKILCQGLYEIDAHGQLKNMKLNESGKEENLDMILDEYANTIAESLLSSDESMYFDKFPILPKMHSYQDISIAGSMMCAAFDIPEKQIAILKDKGRQVFDAYFKKQYPYLQTERIIEAFRDNITMIWNATNQEDRSTTVLGHSNIMGLLVLVMGSRIQNALSNQPNEEFAKRTDFSLIKLQNLINLAGVNFSMTAEETAEQLRKLDIIKDMWCLYKLYMDDREALSPNAQLVLQDIRERGKIRLVELREVVNQKNKSMEEYDLVEIINQYYPDSMQQLNDNTELIGQLKRNFSHSIQIQEKHSAKGNSSEMFRQRIKENAKTLEKKWDYMVENKREKEEIKETELENSI